MNYPKDWKDFVKNKEQEVEIWQELNKLNPNDCENYDTTEHTLKGSYCYAIDTFQRNPIRRSAVAYYSGESKGKQNPHGIPNIVWMKAFADAKKHNFLTID